MAGNKEQKVDKEKTQYYARMAAPQSLISAWKKEGKKRKKTKQIITSPIHVLTPPNRAYLR